MVEPPPLSSLAPSRSHSLALSRPSGSGGGGGNTIVHCSAGIGRTGTFVAIDVIRQRLTRLAERADAAALCAPGALSALPAVEPQAILRALGVPDLVHDLRRQRMGMVQTFEQYCFVYQAVAEDLEALLAT